MNVLGLSLVLTSLATATIFSPSSTQKQGANTIVKEGHRVVVVEYDQDGYQNTKISISPEQPPHHDSDQKVESFMPDNTKDRIKEAASVLPNMGQGISQDSTFLHPKDLICDAYGRCKHKIAGAMGKAKDKAQETLNNANNEVGDTLGKAKETVYDKAQESVEKGKGVGQTVKEHVVRNVSEAGNSVKDAVKGVASNLVSMETLSSLMRVVHLLGFGTAYGMCVWITFISSYVLSKAMPRQQFAVVQSKIYPVYFRAMAYSIGIALLGHVLGHRKRQGVEILQAYNLLASLLTLFANSMYLEPRATKLMFERMKIEKEEGRGRDDMSGERNNRTEEHPKKSSAATATQGTEQDAVRSKIIKLNNRLKKLNSYSSFLNILNLMSLTWHLVYLAQRLHHNC
ncbi:hypothetical protein SESBI_38992 [Sesbania bispinosa]|nr:hypothetical protein SESBI_38992 [Sesbania bispinosa]